MTPRIRIFFAADMTVVPIRRIPDVPADTILRNEAPTPAVLALSPAIALAAAWIAPELILRRESTMDRATGTALEAASRRLSMAVLARSTGF
ncbi:hypothetical protein DSECCO2_487650 [anaerobic digester metagenome]